jgi:START domain
VAIHSRENRLVANLEADMENENAVAGPGNWFRRLVKVNENVEAKPGTWVRRLVKVVSRVSLALVVIYVVASAAWRFSGSNKWEFVREENGVKLYSLKTPGSDLIQSKGVVRVRSTMGGIMKLMMEPVTSNDYGYYELHTIERVDRWFEYRSFRLNLPFPFKTREFVIRSQIYQDPRTKEVLMVVAAAPDKAPPNDCCFRVTVMSNTWRFTPVGNGEIEIEYIHNTDMGGFIPDLALNTQRPKFVVGVLSKLPEFLYAKNYQDAKYDSIEEK